MTFKASTAFFNSVSKLKGSLIRNFYTTLTILIGASFFLYHSYPLLDSTFIICELIMIILLLLLDRLRTVPIGRIIAHTAMEVGFVGTDIIVKTTPFKVLFWINKPSIELQLKVRHFMLTKTPYPVKSIYDLDRKAWKIEKGEIEIFIISDFFDKELEQRISEI